MNCQQARELLPMYEDGELDAPQRQAVEEHLADCPDCRRLLTLQGRLPAMLAQLPAAPRAVEQGVARRVEAALARQRPRGWQRAALLTARGLAAVATFCALGLLLGLAYWLGWGQEQQAGKPTAVAAQVTPAAVVASPTALATARPSAVPSKAPAVAASVTPGKVAFVRAGDIYVKDLPDGEERPLMTGGNSAEPRWSPSGEWLAYKKAGVMQVLRASLVDSRWPVQMVASSYVWAPGSDRLAIVAGGALYVLEAGEGTPRQLVSRQGAAAGDGVSGVAWSPDGKWLAYSSGTTLQPAQNGQSPSRHESLWAIRPDGSENHMLLDAGKPSAGYFIVAGWSPDGGKVLYWYNASFSGSILADGASLNAVPLTAQTADGSRQGVALAKVVPAMLARQDLLAGTPAGNLLAVTAGAFRESWTKKGIDVVDLNTGKVSHLTEAGTAALWPDWSPDGQRLVYVAGPDVGRVGGGEEARQAAYARRLWSMNRDGSDKRPLTGDDRYRDERPEWSADGTYILWGRWQDNSRQLWLMRPDGGEARQVASDLESGGERRADTSIWSGFYGYTDWGQLYAWWQPSRAPARPQPTPAPAPTKASPSAADAAAFLNKAQDALVKFFSALHARHYEEAAAYYGGGYEWLHEWNPSLPADDYAALWRHGCEVNGLKCLQVRAVLGAEQVSENEFKFVVQFSNEDTSLFVIGPCCGATPEQMPPRTEFNYIVIRTEGRYVVQGTPVYVP
ncbi:MAG: zf-HC2 domain-containing protein [Chloroflexota bacterium]